MGEEKSVSPAASCLRRFIWQIGCLVFFIILLCVSFVLGAMYGRDVFPGIFEKAHDGIDKVSEQAHDGLQKMNDEIEDNIDSGKDLLNNE